ncbi:MAG: hypothetical protein GKR90_14255 [Pseudomonadales bacterium]|nr:hypothetical protein [Pseudomonadales bacterium]
MSVDLTDDAEAAKSELEPHVTPLRGLLQMWHMFRSAGLVAEEFADQYDELSYQLKIACTRSLVVDYQKPWSGNYSPEINSLRSGQDGTSWGQLSKSQKKTNGPWKYPFLDPVVNSHEHEALMELRNSIVAHLDKDYEGGGLTLKGVRVENLPQNRPRDPGTLDAVFLPTTPVLAGKRGFWWLSERNHIESLREHISKAEKIVGTEIRDRSSAFRIACIEHLHVISELSDLFGVAATPIEEGNVNVTSQTEDPQPLAMTNPKPLKIGDQNIEALATVYEPRAAYPFGIEIKGKGYTLMIGDEEDKGEGNFQRQFSEIPASERTLTCLLCRCS